MGVPMSCLRYLPLAHHPHPPDESPPPPPVPPVPPAPSGSKASSSKGDPEKARCVALVAST